MALGACVLLPAALGAVRSRAAAAQTTANPSLRRPTLTAHVKAHFFCSVATAACWAAGLGGIVWHKSTLEKAHLASLHSQLGASAVALWVAAGIAAELKVNRVIRLLRLLSACARANNKAEKSRL